MLYVLIGEDAAGSLAKRMAVRPAHLARLEALRDEGRLVVAGPMPGGRPDARDRFTRAGPGGFLRQPDTPSFRHSKTQKPGWQPIPM